MDFPRSVYLSPGNVLWPGGATYKYLVVSSKDELRKRLEEGWFEQIHDAVAAAGDEAYLHGLNRRRYAKMKALLQKKAKQRKETIAQEPVTVQAQIEAEEETNMDAAPTRAELEEQCAKLGIRFDRRYGDKRLARMIEDKLIMG